MAKGKGKKGSKVAKKNPGIKRNPLFESRPRNFRVGNDIQPKRDLTRFVRWPKYIQLQRQKRVLMQRLKVPPTINQFTHTLESNQARNLFRLLSKYATEGKKQKKERLLAAAKDKVEGAKKDDKTAKPQVLKYGLNHITHLVENKEAKLVVIAHDVDPIELVMWLPALCRKQDVPYCFVKGKARLGKLVHKKTATAVALTGTRKEDAADLETLTKNFRAQYNDNAGLRKEWGGGKIGIKSTHKQEAHKHALEEEIVKKA